MSKKEKVYKKRLKHIHEDVLKLSKCLPDIDYDESMYDWESINRLISDIEVASDMKNNESVGWVEGKIINVPTHDPQTGELNPYYEEITGMKNPLTGQIEKKYDALPFCKEYITKEQLDDIEDLWKRGYPKKPKRIHRLPEVDVKKVSKSAEGSSKKLHTYPTKEQIDDIEYVSKNLMKGLKTPPIKGKNIDKMPDQKWHQIVSFIKSGVRIVGYCFIPFNLVVATILLVFSEIIGIIEEMV